MTIQHCRLAQDPLRKGLMEGLLCLHIALSHLPLVEVLSRLRLVEVLLRLCLVEVPSHLCLMEALSYLRLAEVLSHLCLVEALSCLCLAEVLLCPRLAEALLFLAGILLLPSGDPFLQVLVAGPFQSLTVHQFLVIHQICPRCASSNPFPVIPHLTLDITTTRMSRKASYRTAITVNVHKSVTRPKVLRVHTRTVM